MGVNEKINRGKQLARKGGLKKQKPKSKNTGGIESRGEQIHEPKNKYERKERQSWKKKLRDYLNGD